MAAATNERVMEMVRKELEKNPTVKSQELFEKAKKLDSGLNDLSIRQFHASYPLQVKRMASKSAGGGGRGRKRAAAPSARKASGRRAGRPRGRPRKAAEAAAPAATAPRRGRRRGTAAQPRGGSGREGVRSILMQFAGELAGAENRADVVQVIGSVDAYVDRLMQAAAS